MKSIRQVALGAAATLVMGSSGCAEFMAQMQAQQAAQNALTPAQAANIKSANASVAGVADETQDAMKIAAEADAMRDAIVPNYQSVFYAYRRALELEPRNTYILVAQATAYLRQGSDAKYSGAGGTAVSDPAKLAIAATSFTRAKVSAEKALQVNPNYGTAHFLIGEMFALQGDFVKALEKFDFIATNKLIPAGHVSTFYAWRGYAKKMNNDETGAQADLNQAIELSEPADCAEYSSRLLNPPPAGTPIERRAIISAF